MDPREYERMFALEERHWWYRALRRRIFQALRRAPWSDPPKVSDPDVNPRALVCLDAGCGSGMNLRALVDRGPRQIGRPIEVHGFDASRLALTFAVRRGLHRLACASVEAIPWPDGSADLVLSADVIYHRGVRDDRAALREMARCLRPGGILIVNVPAFGWLRSAHDVAIHTARRYTRRMLVARLRAAGLEPVRVGYWNWLLFAPLAAVRLVRAIGRCRAPSTSSGEGDSVPASDLGAVPAPLNALLDALLACEAALGWLPVPAGLSLMAVARKPVGEPQR